MVSRGKTLATTQNVIFVNTRRKANWLTGKMRPHDHTVSVAHRVMYQNTRCVNSDLVPLVCLSLLIHWPVVLISNKSLLWWTMTTQHNQKTTFIDLGIVEDSGGRGWQSTLWPRMKREWQLQSPTSQCCINCTSGLHAWPHFEWPPF